MLPGPSSPYLIVWWFDEAARNTQHHVSPLAVSREVEKWLGPHRQTLWDIYSALDGSQAKRLSEIRGDEKYEQLKKSLVEAFLGGWLVAIKSEHFFPPQAFSKRPNSAARLTETPRTEDYVLRFGQEDFVLSFELLPPIGTRTDGQVRVVFQPVDITRAYQSKVKYWDAQGREVSSGDSYTSMGTRSVTAVPFQKLLAIPDRTRFRGSFARDVSSGGATGYTFDLDGDGSADFGVSAVVRSDKHSRDYAFTLFDNKKPEQVGYHFIQDEAWTHGYQGNSSPRREVDDFFEEFLRLTVDVGTGMIPIVSEIIDLAEVVTGYSKWGTKMTTGERVVTALALLLPVVGGATARRALRGGVSLADSAATLGRSEDHLMAALKAVEKRSADKSAIDSMQASLRAGKALTQAELWHLQRILQQVDADQRFYRAVEQGASAESILRRGGKIAAETGPVSLKHLRNVLGRAGVSPSPYSLRKASKTDLDALRAQGLTPEQVWAWVGRDGSGNVIADWRGRPIITFTAKGLASLEDAVKSFGHEVQHLKDFVAGRGTTERGAEKAGIELWELVKKRVLD